MRGFVALEVSDRDTLESLVGFQAELKGTGADLKLVGAQNLHFTVKFLGELSDAQVAEARTRLAGLRLSGAEVEVRGVGAFPSASRPRVVWAGLPTEDEGKVAPIAEAVIGALRGIGEEDRRGFQAHITLARVRSARNVGALGALLEANRTKRFGRVGLAQLKLKSSTLTPDGPTYADVGVYPLV
jgi:RNA 2',3'-cyclic 3'-phosphodiesterase